MQRLTEMIVALVLASLLLVAASSAGPVPGASSLRIRRSSADQRIAELQALMALAGSSNKVAHGQFDPWELGKRKRSSDVSETERYNLLRNLIEKAAENNMPQ